MTRRLSMSHLSTLAKIIATVNKLEQETPCRAILFRASHKHSDYFKGTDGHFYHYISLTNSYIMATRPDTKSPCYILGDDEYCQYLFLKQSGASNEAIYLYFLQYGVDNKCWIQQ